MLLSSCSKAKKDRIAVKVPLIVQNTSIENDI